jgi:hypothetical protein
LYSYINVENERIFNNIEFQIQIPGESKKPKEYYENNIYKFIDIPNDIKIENGEGEIEFLVIIKPNTYIHYKIKDNDYKI